MSITHETPITEIAALENLSIRALNICKSNYIDTLGELLGYTPDIISRLRSCGPKSASELVAIIDKYRDVPRSIADSPDFYSMLDTLPLALEQWRLEHNGVKLLAVTLNFGKTPPAKLINSILRDREAFYQNLDCTPAGNQPYLFIDYIIEFCLDWQLHIGHTTGGRSRCLDSLIELLEAKNDGFRLLRSYRALPEFFREALQAEFDAKFDQLSVRTQNTFRVYHRLEDSINLVGTDRDIKSLRLRGCGAVSRAEFQRFIDRFAVEVCPLITNPEKGLYEHLKGYMFLRVSRDLPFLSEQECEDIAHMRMASKELPWIELFIKYIRRSDSRGACAYRLVYGFDSECVGLTLEEAGQNLGISGERVRQLSMKKLDFPPRLMQHSDAILKYIDRPVMADYLPVWHEIIGSWGLDVDARRLMALVCALDDTYTIVSLSAKSSSYLVKKELLQNVKLMTSLRELMKRYNMRKTRSEEFSIEPYVRLSLPRDSFHPKVHLIYPIFLDYMKALDDVVTIRDNFVVLASNKLSVEDCLVDILERNGSSMSYKQICHEFVKAYPDFKLTNVTTLRSYILRSPRILPVGRSGRYVLSHWSEIFTGSLTELMIRCIREAGRPLSLSEIYNKVLRYFPDTNEKSLTTLIYLDKGKNFVTLGASLYGLVGVDYPDVEPNVPRFITRLPFEQRFKQVKDFVAEHGRMPMNIDKQESTLWHWIENVEAGNIFYTEEQWEDFRRFRAENALLPQNSGELRFRSNCKKIKDLVADTNRMPAIKNNPFEYTWFSRNKRIYADIDMSKSDGEQPDNRSRYFADLLRFLISRGMEVR